LRATAALLGAALALAACQGGGAGRGGAGAAGLPAMSPDRALERAAISQAAYMAAAGRMEHATGPGRDFAARMRAAGIAAPAAENLAHGRMEPQRLVSMWMALPGHRANMLDPRFSRYGLAHASDGDGQRYWAMVLGR
jgi:uncharacterized protein YkwD